MAATSYFSFADMAARAAFIMSTSFTGPLEPSTSSTSLDSTSSTGYIPRPPRIGVKAVLTFNSVQSIVDLVSSVYKWPVKLSSPLCMYLLTEIPSLACSPDY